VVIIGLARPVRRAPGGGADGNHLGGVARALPAFRHSGFLALLVVGSLLLWWSPDTSPALNRLRIGHVARGVDDDFRTVGAKRERIGLTQRHEVDADERLNDVLRAGRLKKV
jgi:hypothetical protein